MSEYLGPNTPPFRSSSDPWSPPPSTGYPAQPFPAPPGVPPLQPAGSGNQRRPRVRGLLAAATLSALIGAGAGVGSYAYIDQTRGTGGPISVTTVQAQESPPVEGTVAAAAAKISPSVVTITVVSGRGGGIGTGVVLDRAGHILTNHHVVGDPGAGEITVTFKNGKTARANVTGTSETNDLAVIKVEGVSDLTPAVFAKSDSIRIGQTVVAVGAPLGLSDTVTSGIVSNTARPVRSGDNNDAVYMAVQTDAAINPGNSGGPLVDLNGSVVGINSSIASTAGPGGQAGNIGIGFAIPSDVATRVAAELIADGSSTNAVLGVTLPAGDQRPGVGIGVPLEAVADGSAAAQAGLQPGDVVTRLNDFPTPTADALIAATRFYAPDTEVRITYQRDGVPNTVTVKLGSA
jgi:putative serine protease PepD